MSETTPGVLEPTSEAALPFDLATAETVSYADVLRLRQAVYASEGNRRHFEKVVDALEERLSGAAAERAWRGGAARYILGRYAEAAEVLRKGAAPPTRRASSV